jgi:heavy metal translocating P-type ATPase
MDGLIALGALASFGVSAMNVVQGGGHIYFDTAAMLLLLVTVGKLIEASARVDASRALEDLVQLRPSIARLVTESGDMGVPVEQVQVGDRLRVRPGERVPVDGRIAAGRSSVQERALTGEFDPRLCGPDDRVFGGSVNGEGEITVEATVVGEGALLDRIARLVRRAQAARSPAERTADRAAAAFVPLVVAIAAWSGAYWMWHGDGERAGMSALAVLVVACPCALGLATPLAVWAALTRAASEGTIVRTGEAFETLSRVTQVFFDKTGTLTEGRPELREIRSRRGAACSEDEALAWLATLESASEHAVAGGIVRAARERGLALGEVSDFRAFPGEGAHGRVEIGGEKRGVWAGTLQFLSRRGVDVSSADELPDAEPGATVLYLSWGDGIDARVSLSDAPREGAAAAVRELRRLGAGVALLSGDRAPAAERLSGIVGIDDIRAERTPAGKIADVQRARADGHIVAVVGDGINDAPALAEADVGIAMGGGTDLAREVGDVTLLRDALHLVPWAMRLARRTRQVIRQNLIWAFGYNLIALALAFFGYLHPLLAALAMLGSSLFVIHNSLRFARRERTRTDPGVVRQEA